MGIKEKKWASHEAPAANAAKAPIEVFRIEDVSASVFSREHPVNGENRTFYSVSFSRSYSDGNGKRQYVKTFNPEDLAKVSSVAEQAYLFCNKRMESEKS